MLHMCDQAQLKKVNDRNNFRLEGACISATNFAHKRMLFILLVGIPFDRSSYSKSLYNVCLFYYDLFYHYIYFNYDSFILICILKF
jgi:hypothetical protein